MEETFGLSVFTTSKKRRGRPRKADTILLPAEMTVLGVLQTASSKRKTKSKARTVKSSCDDSLPRDGQQSEVVGQAVHGVVDGSFDAGFLVSLRVGESENVYRGVVFGPGLCIPLSENSDVAAKVNASRREQTPGSPAPPAQSPKPPPENSSHAPSSTIRTPPFFTCFGSSNSDLRQLTSKQELASPFQLHSGFMHPSASFQSAAQGFGSREFCSPYSLTGAEIGCSMFSAGGQAED